MHGLFRTFGLATEVLAFADHPEDALDLAAAGAQVLAVGAGVLHRLGGRGRAAVVRGEAPADSDRQARLRVSRS
jgi:hypothetical protein